jgi:hypothetical protein
MWFIICEYTKFIYLHFYNILLGYLYFSTIFKYAFNATCIKRRYQI